MVVPDVITDAYTLWNIRFFNELEVEVGEVVEVVEVVEVEVEVGEVGVEVPLLSPPLSIVSFLSLHLANTPFHNIDSLQYLFNNMYWLSVLVERTMMCNLIG